MTLFTVDFKKIIIKLLEYGFVGLSQWFDKTLNIISSNIRGIIIHIICNPYIIYDQKKISQKDLKKWFQYWPLWNSKYNFPPGSINIFIFLFRFLSDKKSCTKRNAGRFKW